jgi:hypothetical protein
MQRYSLVSSANSPTPVEDDSFLGKSLIYTEKRKGPNNDPCGTPDVMDKVVDVAP